MIDRSILQNAVNALYPSNYAPPNTVPGAGGASVAVAEVRDTDAVQVVVPTRRMATTSYVHKLTERYQANDSPYWTEIFLVDCQISRAYRINGTDSLATGSTGHRR